MSTGEKDWGLRWMTFIRHSKTNTHKEGRVIASSLPFLSCNEVEHLGIYWSLGHKNFGYKTGHDFI